MAVRLADWPELDLAELLSWFVPYCEGLMRLLV